MFVTITKADINDIAVASFFPDQAPLAVVPGDPDANPANFREAWEPAPVPIFLGARVQLTKNIHKEMDYVNGMGATILVVYPWTDGETRATYHPMRLGYANTLTMLGRALLCSVGREHGDRAGCRTAAWPRAWQPEEARASSATAAAAHGPQLELEDRAPEGAVLGLGGLHPFELREITKEHEGRLVPGARRRPPRSG